MVDLNNMLYFAEVVDQGGFAAAGRSLLGLLRLLILSLDLLAAILLGLLGLLVRVGSPRLLQSRRPAAQRSRIGLLLIAPYAADAHDTHSSLSAFPRE